MIKVVEREGIISEQKDSLDSCDNSVLRREGGREGGHRSMIMVIGRQAAHTS